ESAFGVAASTSLPARAGAGSDRGTIPAPAAPEHVAPRAVAARCPWAAVAGAIATVAVLAAAAQAWHAASAPAPVTPPRQVAPSPTTTPPPSRTPAIVVSPATVPSQPPQQKPGRAPRGTV